MTKKQKITLDLLPTQELALKYLEDKETLEVCYGGGAGGGKTYLGAMWILKSAIQYPETVYLVGRDNLDNLVKTSLQTMFRILKSWGFREDIDYTYHRKEYTLSFANGSLVYFKDLHYYPQDPEYERLGSYEFTYVWLEEASELTEKCKDICISRMRLKHTDYGIEPKILITCNPKRNWLYRLYYLPSKIDNLVSYRKFVQSLSNDNKYLKASYIRNLHRLDKISVERLAKGNWEYDISNDILFSYQTTLDCYYNNNNLEGDYYITCDVAGEGADNTAIVLWLGYTILEIYVYTNKKTTEIADIIQSLAVRYKIAPDCIIIDDNGIGTGIVDKLNCYGFLGQSKALNGENYKNLRTQCYYRLSEYINDGKISIQTTDNTKSFQEAICEELEATKRDNIDGDKKYEIISKKEIKKVLGRSPDLADAISMRMVYAKSNEYISISSNDLIIMKDYNYSKFLNSIVYIDSSENNNEFLYDEWN